MDYDSRSQVIHDNFIVKMASMYQAPKHIAGNQDAKKTYCREIREAINKRLDSRIPNVEVMVSLLDEIWQKCISENTYRLYFTPALVMKHTNKVSADYQMRQNKNDAAFEQARKNAWDESSQVKASKEDAGANGWTIEKCDKHIADMQRMIADGEYPKQLGEMLMRIPMKAKQRLLNAGQTTSN